MLTGNEMQLARGETIADTARVLSRYVDAIMIRLLDHEMVEELAPNATIPVINGLTEGLASLPGDGRCDDLRGEKGPIAGATVAWSGDGNNVLTSWVHAAAVRLQAARRRAHGIARRAETARLGASAAASRTSATIRKRRWKAPIAWSPMPGFRWATTTPPSATISCGPIR